MIYSSLACLNDALTQMPTTVDKRLYKQARRRKEAHSANAATLVTKLWRNPWLRG
jgi:hypothetical protein